MKTPALQPDELTLMRKVFQRHLEIKAVKLFGSRAKGTHAGCSDIDLALWGDVDALQAESIAAELTIAIALPIRREAVSSHQAAPAARTHRAGWNFRLSAGVIYFNPGGRGPKALK